MMDFATPQDTALGMVVTARWLPVLVRSFERCVEDLGLEIVERSHFVDAGGRACPLLHLRGRRIAFRFGLRSAMEEWLAVDRRARPARVDRRLLEEAYAARKIEMVVARWLEVLGVIEGSRDAAEARARAEELVSDLHWTRDLLVEEHHADDPRNGVPSPANPRPVCRLSDTDGNVFAVVGRVREALRRGGESARA